MYELKPIDRPSPRDLLITRPDKTPLPTPLEPASPEARGYPADPKPMRKRELPETGEWEPLPEDVGQSA